MGKALGGPGPSRVHRSYQRQTKDSSRFMLYQQVNSLVDRANLESLAVDCLPYGNPELIPNGNEAK
jgi:hypothetical protein